ncbi:MAG: hypothetical protein R2695_17430 [Acidimicrobiales bacterium]
MIDDTLIEDTPIDDTLIDDTRARDAGRRRACSQGGSTVLTELVVRDLGVIDELSLILGPGMTAVTGETGAGKTLIVGAIDLLTGGRADATLVRPGADEAEIEGRFVVGDDEIVIRRVIPREGRSRVYVDGRLATVAALSEQGTDLVDLHGQHAHQSLLKGPVQRTALDRFGAIDTSALAALTDDLRAVDSALDELGGDERARAREIDLLQHQLDEIEAAGIAGPDEDARLDHEEDLLADASAHREAAAAAVGLLDADGAATDGLDRAIAELNGRTPFADLETRLRSVAVEVADVAGELRDRAETIEDDPARLATLRERRALLRELRRKYGDDLGEVIAFASDAGERLAELRSHDDRAAALDARRAELVAARAAEQARVRAARQAAAPRLAREVETHLQELAMPGARREGRGRRASPGATSCLTRRQRRPRTLLPHHQGRRAASWLAPCLREQLDKPRLDSGLDEVDAGGPGSGGQRRAMLVGVGRHHQVSG